MRWLRAVEVVEIVLALAIYILLARYGLIDFSRLREGKW